MLARSGHGHIMETENNIDPEVKLIEDACTYITNTPQALKMKRDRSGGKQRSWWSRMGRYFVRGKIKMY